MKVVKGNNCCQFPEVVVSYEECKDCDYCNTNVISSDFIECFCEEIHSNDIVINWNK